MSSIYTVGDSDIYCGCSLDILWVSGGYILWALRIYTVGTVKIYKLLKEMQEALAFPKDVEDLLQTSLFLSNRLVVCRSAEDVLQPAQKPGLIHWFVIFNYLQKYLTEKY